MHTLHAFLVYPIAGAPLWTLLLLAGAATLNDLIQRSKNIRAQSLLQAIGNGAHALLGSPIGKIPIVSQVILILWPVTLIKTPVAVTLDGAEVVARRNNASGSIEFKLLLALGCTGLLFALAMCGCAAGTDGLRQSCANADAALSGGYQVAASWYHTEQVEIRALAARNPVEAARRFDADETTMGKVLVGLDAAKDSKLAICKLPDAIDAGLKRDIPSLIAQLLSLLNDVRVALTPIAGVS